MALYNEQIWILITRMLSAEADAAEQKKFQQWLEEDEINSRFYHKLKVLWDEEPDKKVVHTAYMFAHEKGLQKLRFKLEAEKSKPPAQTFKTYKLPRRTFAAWKIAAAVILLIAGIAVFGVMHYWSPPLKTYTTTAAEQRIIKLPDGSQVRLNRSSEIAFAKGFSGEKRTVKLTGEAFFKVKHNAKKPFIVHAGDAVIRDIGTAFNVKSEQNGKVVVVVKEGVASLQNSRSNRNKPIVLEKDQIGILQKNQLTKLNPKNIQNYLSWMNGKIVFTKMPFSKVINQLNNIYGFREKMADSSLAALKLTAYTQDTSLQNVLHMIALSLDITYRVKGNTIIWKKNSNK